MWNTARVAVPLCALVFGSAVGSACAGDDGDPGSVATEPTVAVTSGDDGESTSTQGAAMTVESLCNPLDEVVTDWAGADVEREHIDLFATDDPASLTCQWQQDAPDYREVRVIYHASPAVWDATVAAGGDPLDSVGADNRYDGEILSVHADNGWTIDVVAFEGDPPDYAAVPDAVASVANEALVVVR